MITVTTVPAAVIRIQPREIDIDDRVLVAMQRICLDSMGTSMPDEMTERVVNCSMANRIPIRVYLFMIEALEAGEKVGMSETPPRVTRMKPSLAMAA